MSQSTPKNTKRLLILRHALALPSSAAIKDIDRDLAPRGIEDANALGRFMKSRDFTPELALCSPAKRTRHTLEGLKKNITFQQILFLEILYSGTVDDYLFEIQHVNSSINTILVVAHNPSIYELAILLSGRGIESHMQRLSEGYKPATLSVLNYLNDNWEELQPASCELVDISDPLDYNAPQRPTRWM